MPLRIWLGMRVHLTKNVRKDIGYVNGMLATVVKFDLPTRGVHVRAATGHRVLLTPWTDADLDNITYYLKRPGSASTALKFQGAALDHVTFYLDHPGVPGGVHIRSQPRPHWERLGPLAVHYFTPAR